MISDGVVPGEAQFVKEAGYQASFQRSHVRVTVKLEIFEANCGLASVSRGGLSFCELK